MVLLSVIRLSLYCIFLSLVVSWQPIRLQPLNIFFWRTSLTHATQRQQMLSLAATNSMPFGDMKPFLMPDLSNMGSNEGYRTLKKVQLDPDLAAKIRALPETASADEVMKVLKETGLYRVIEDEPDRPHRKDFEEFFYSACTKRLERDLNGTDTHVDATIEEREVDKISYRNFCKYPLLHQWIEEGRITKEDIYSSFRAMYGSPVTSIKLTLDEAFDMVHVLFDSEDIDQITFVKDLFQRLLKQRAKRETRKSTIETATPIPNDDNHMSNNKTVYWKHFLKSAFIRDLINDEVFTKQEIQQIASRALKCDIEELSVDCEKELSEDEFLKVNRYLLIELSDR